MTEGTTENKGVGPPPDGFGKQHPRHGQTALGHGAREASPTTFSFKGEIDDLRPGEFANFTSLEKMMPIMKGLLAEVGAPFFRVLVDAAHCGDSDLDLPQNEALIAELADAGMLGPFHCSATTTRGCLTSDDGWISALLAAAARTGKLESAFVEVFTHDDPALQGLRDLDPGHGIDTTDGRTYTQVMVDGLIETARRLNNLKSRGIL